MGVIKMSDLPTTKNKKLEVAKNWAELKIHPDNKANQELITKNSPNPLHSIVSDGAWRGRRCFIVGGGESLKNFDWRMIDGELTIGINKALEKIEPDILFSMDSRFYRWITNGELGNELKEKFEKFRGIKVWLNTHNFKGFGEDVYLLDSAGEKAFTFSLKDGLGHGNNSGYSALNLAVCLGANPIYLLGFDMKGRDGRQSWWHKGYPVIQQESAYDKMIECFNFASGKIAEAGFRVINVNPDSRLDCFEKIGFDEIPRNKTPLFVSYYTKGTIYEWKVRTLESSLKKLWLKYDIVGIENLGSWQKNTYHKAKFIREMLDKHPHNDLVFVDADAVVWEYPELFENINEDIAVRVFKGKEILSGTVFVKNSDRGKEIINRWIEINKKYSNRWEQKNLADVLKNYEFKPLPDEYCYIQGLEKRKKAVIEHFQASRIWRWNLCRVQ